MLSSRSWPFVFGVGALAAAGVANASIEGVYCANASGTFRIEQEPGEAPAYWRNGAYLPNSGVVVALTEQKTFDSFGNKAYRVENFAARLSIRSKDLPPCPAEKPKCSTPDPYLVSTVVICEKTTLQE